MRLDYSPTRDARDKSDMQRLTLTTTDDSTMKEAEPPHKQQATQTHTSSSDGAPNFTQDPTNDYPNNTTNSPTPQYRLYKRRYLGLTQLVLLNIIVSWDWLTFAAVSSTASTYFSVPESSINWLSTGFLFAFVPVSPLVIWTLHAGGPKPSILVASLLVLAGNWIRYAGGRNFGVVIFGQILIGFAQPFVLAAPTRYSNLWFSDSGRVTATAIASLANPLGAALGQLIGPLWAPSSMSRMVLYTSILSTAVTIPAPFLPRAPPTPPSSLAAEPKPSLTSALKTLPKNGSFYLLLLPFTIYVGFFNAVSSLLNQIMAPYAYTETEAGIAGGLLILIGLLASAIVSPYIDRTKHYATTIKLLVPLIASSYLALIFMPATRSVVGPYLVCSILGATSFSLLPCALEFLVIVTYPVSPELTSTIAWTGGQLLGGVFIVVMNALREVGWQGEPEGSMKGALVFVAVVAWAVVPLPMFLGRGRFRRDGKVGEEVG